MISEGRIRLRALEEGDLERTRAWVNDPEVARLVNRLTPAAAMPLLIVSPSLAIREAR